MTFVLLLSLKKYNKELAYPLNEDGFKEPTEDEITANDAGNMIISKNARFSLAGTPDLYSCAFIQGPIGSGKSFKYVKPNILQMNASYIVTDPACELIASLGTCLMEHGYDIKLFNLKRGEHQFSCRYNPFNYIHDEQDVILTVDASTISKAITCSTLDLYTEFPSFNLSTVNFTSFAVKYAPSCHFIDVSIFIT